jgi:protein-export membrane protein SecD
MKSRNVILLIIIAILTLVAVYVDLPSSPGLHINLGFIKANRDFEIKQGLDLQGGLQVLLEADLPADQKVDAAAMSQVAAIISNRVNALGVVEPLVQTQGSRRIIIELPGLKEEDKDAAVATFRETGLLEFVDAGNTFLPPAPTLEELRAALTEELGSEPSADMLEERLAQYRVVTTYPQLVSEGAIGGEIVPTEAAPTPAAGETITPTTPVEPTTVYPTVLAGNHLKTATAYRDPNTGEIGIQFELTEEGAQIFGDFTTAHADYGNAPLYYLSIVLDKLVISSPHIQGPIPDGQGVIQGSFTIDEAQRLAIQLRYGALPIPLKVETTRSVGPTLGQDSVQRSIRAGAVGLLIVLVFMLVYYRLPGLLADLALILYGLLNFAIYKAGWPVLLIIGLLMIVGYLADRRDMWPLVLGALLLVASIVLATAGFLGVTLTLPAITGFILSTGMAVDANILVFERMKEELRAGRGLNSAIEAGFSRAWTSIRDSNISTLITCAILFYFGSTFGAGAVRGFAITLALGVLINMFTAITVTRSFMRLAFDWLGEKVQGSKFLLGV